MTAFEERVVVALERIADAVSSWVPDVAPGEPVVPCRHPSDAVEDTSTMGQERWRCRLCGEGVGDALSRG